MAIERSVRIKVETGNAKSEINGLSKSLRDTDSAAKSAAASADKTEKEYISLGESASKVAKQNTVLNKSLNDTESKLSNASTKLGGIRRSAGAASIQLQQFVGQVQGGVSPMIALSQQAADLGIVLGAPLIGSIVGIAAAVATSLVPSMFDAEDKSKLLEEALERLSKIAPVTGDGVAQLSDEIEILAKRSEDAAIARISVGLADAQNVILGTSRSVGELSKELSGITASDISNAVSDLDRIAASGGDASVVIEELRGTYAATIKEINDLISTVDALTSTYGINNEQASELIRLLGEVERTKSTESVKSLAAFLSKLASQTNYSNSELNKLSAGVNDASLQMDDAESATRLLQSALDNLNGSLGNTVGAAAGAASALSQYGTQIGNLVAQIQSAQLQLQGLNREAAIQAELARLGEGATDDQRKAVEEFAGKLFDLKQEQIAQTEAERESARAQRESILLSEQQARLKQNQVDANIRLRDSLKNSLIVAMEDDKRVQTQLIAVQRLNKTATQDLKDEVAQLAGELYDASEANNSQIKTYDELKGQLDPIAALTNNYTQFIKDLTAAQLDDNQERELAVMATDQYKTKLNELQLEADIASGKVGGLAVAMGAGMQSATMSASDSFEAFSNVGKNVIDGLSNEITKFISTGEADFRSFAASIIAELLKIQTQILLTKLLGNFFGGGGVGPSFGGSVAPAVSLGSAASKTIKVTDQMSRGAVVDYKYASGGLPSLGEFSNSVVSTPTKFSMGSSAGQMGEAGAEAILPLQRTAGGELGVKANMSQGVAAPAPEVNVPVQVINVTERPSDYLSSPAGTKQIVNIMRENREAFA